MADEEEEGEVGEVEEEVYFILEEEYVPPANPRLERIKNQCLACFSPLLGALAAGLASTTMFHHFMEYRLELGWDFDYIFWHPLVGDAPGIILAVPLLYFAGRRYALFASQLFFLVALLVLEYFHEQQTALKYHLRLPEEFVVWVVLHGCVRTHYVVMVVYVVEVAQPSYRGPLLAACFPFFMVGMYWGRFNFQKEALLLALIVLCVSVLFALAAPETPYWLARKGDEEGAWLNFRQLRGGEDDDNEFPALLEATSPDAERQPLLATFGSALAKMVFLFMGTDSVCRVFMSHLTSPLLFYRYDNTYEHEVYVTEEPTRAMYMYPLAGSVAFVLLCSFLGRRVLYLLSVGATFLIFYARAKLITFDMEEARVRSAELCYLASHMGATQIVLMVSGEIFPGKLREFGVAICELMQFGLQYADLYYSAGGSEWNIYSIIRLILIPMGMLLTIVFLPETRNKTLVEVEVAAGKMEPVFLRTATIVEGLEQDEEQVERNEGE